MPRERLVENPDAEGRTLVIPKGQQQNSLNLCSDEPIRSAQQQNGYPTGSQYARCSAANNQLPDARVAISPHYQQVNGLFIHSS